MPPPHLLTAFADVSAFDTNKRQMDTPTPESRLTDALMRMIRRAAITAAPPAHIRPTVWSDSVDLSANVSVPAAASTTGYTIAVTFKCPPGRGARIEQYGVNVLDDTYTYDGSILWAFRMNGRKLDLGMSDWGEQRGSMVFPRKTVIVMNEGDSLEFLVKRAVAHIGSQTVQMGFRGWIWRKRNNSEGTQSSVTAY